MGQVFMADAWPAMSSRSGPAPNWRKAMSRSPTGTVDSGPMKAPSPVRVVPGSSVVAASVVVVVASVVVGLDSFASLPQPATTRVAARTRRASRCTGRAYVRCSRVLGVGSRPLRADCPRQTAAMTRKRLVGPAVRQVPRLDDELTDRHGDALAPHELLEDVRWEGGAPEVGVPGVEIVRSWLVGIRLTGLELVDLRLLDVVLVDCELSGAVLVGARFERAVFTRCRMSGVVAAELQAEDVRFDGCQMDQAWLRASRLDRNEVVDCDLRGADLYDARVTRSAFRRCDLTELDVHGSDFEAVSLHGSTIDRLKGAEALHDVTIGSDQLVPLALPVLAAQRIRVDDDAPDLVEEPPRHPG